MPTFDCLNKFLHLYLRLGKKQSTERWKTLKSISFFPFSFPSSSYDRYVVLYMETRKRILLVSTQNFLLFLAAWTCVTRKRQEGSEARWRTWATLKCCKQSLFAASCYEMAQINSIQEELCFLWGVILITTNCEGLPAITRAPMPMPQGISRSFQFCWPVKWNELIHDRLMLLMTRQLVFQFFPLYALISIPAVSKEIGWKQIMWHSSWKLRIHS